MLKPLLVRLEAAGGRVIAYADDLLILVAGNIRTQLTCVATQRLEIVRSWGEEVGVPVNLQKTRQMLLKGSLSRPPSIRLGGDVIGYSQAVKYLGIRISERWDFFGHLADIHTKVQKTTGSIRRVLRKEWGLSLATSLHIYRGLYVPCIAYGAILWAGSLSRPHFAKRLNQAQRVALTAILPVCRTAPTAAMQVLAGELPWDLEVRYRATKARLRRGEQPGDALVEPERLIDLNEKERSAVVLDVFLDEWQRRWDDENTGRVTHRWISKVRYARLNRAFSPSYALTCLLTGHGTNSLLQSRGLEASARCASCDTSDETWTHILVDCPQYADIRCLEDWRITIGNDGEPDVGTALENAEQVCALDSFAREAFRRRDEFLPEHRRRPR